MITLATNHDNDLIILIVVKGSDFILKKLFAFDTIYPFWK